MASIAPERVLLLEAQSVLGNINAIEARLKEPKVASLEDVPLFEALTHWLATHVASL